MTSLADLSHYPQPSAAADDALTKLGVTGETRRLLYPAVVSYFTGLRRAKTRTIEREVAASCAPTAEAMTAVRFMREGFKVTTDGGWTRWAEATIEQHEERIAFLRRMVRGHEETIRLHEKAVRLLRSTGRSCLGDLAASLHQDDAA